MNAGLSLYSSRLHKVNEYMPFRCHALWRDLNFRKTDPSGFFGVYLNNTEYIHEKDFSVSGNQSGRDCRDVGRVVAAGRKPLSLQSRTQSGQSAGFFAGRRVYRFDHFAADE